MMAAAMNDEELELLDRWCAGDATAGNALFRRHYEAVYRFFSAKVDGEVEDLAQETFLACVRERQRFLRHSTFRTYLFAIAKYTLYGYWRRRARSSTSPQPVEELSIASMSTSACSRITRREDHARLLAALQQLPLEQQLLLELHYWEELERDQLAEVFEVEPATTRSRLFRARQALRELLAAAEVAPRPREAAIGAAPPQEDPELEAWARSVWRSAARSPEQRGGSRH
jgi:RNA polymerase sigma-70 factor (ECF subfamily)